MTDAIDLEVLTEGKVHNLSGHERGLAARRYFNLDALDESIGEVEIRVPEHIYGVSPSFVQGLLSESVKKLGSTREGFSSHYKLVASDLVRRQFDRGLVAILTSRDYSVI